MNVISGLRNRLFEAVDEAVEKAREVVHSSPTPSAAVDAHAARASVDAAKNSEASHKEPGIFFGSGVSGAVGVDEGIGGQVSAGYVVGANGTAKGYASTGVVNGSMGATAGAGFEAGVVFDVPKLYGDGYQLSISAPRVPVGVNLSFTRDTHEWTGVSISAGKSAGGGIFEFDTHTDETSVR